MRFHTKASSRGSGAGSGGRVNVRKLNEGTRMGGKANAHRLRAQEAESWATAKSKTGLARTSYPGAESFGALVRTNPYKLVAKKVKRLAPKDTRA